MKSTGAVIGMAAASAAMMIPSTMSLSEEQLDAFDRLNSFSPDAPARYTHTIKLDCPDCASLDHPASFVEEADDDVALILNFEVDDSVLNVNGHRLFPHTPFEHLTAHQVPAGIDSDALKDHLAAGTVPPRRLLFGSTARSTEAADGSDAQLIDLDLRINGVDETDITVDALSLRLLQDEQGRISIADIIRIPSNGPAEDMIDFDEPESEAEYSILPLHPITPIPEIPNGASAKSQESCNGPPFLCRMKDLVESKIGMMRETMDRHFDQSFKYDNEGVRKVGGCHGMRGGRNGRPPFPLKGGPNKFAGFGQGYPHGFHHGRHGHHGHHHHSPMHRLAHIMHKVFFGFVLPVLIGVAAGLTASMIGMIVGTTAAWLWFRFARGGKRGNASLSRNVVVPVVTITDASATEDEKEGLLNVKDVVDEEEALPEYTEKQ